MIKGQPAVMQCLGICRHTCRTPTVIEWDLHSPTRNIFKIFKSGFLNITRNETIEIYILKTYFLILYNVTIPNNPHKTNSEL